MRDDHVEQVMAVMKGVAPLRPQVEHMLRERLSDLDLKSGRASYLGKKRDPKSVWISTARKWARNVCLMGKEVNIEMVLERNPLPPTVDKRAIGGVFKHPDFARVGDIRTKRSDGRYKTIGSFRLKSQIPEPAKDAITDWG